MTTDELKNIQKERLQYIKKELGYTTEEMAQYLNVSVRTYQDWLYGINKLPTYYANVFDGLYKGIKDKKKKDIWGMVATSALFGLSIYGLSLLADIEISKTETDDNPDDDED